MIKIERIPFQAAEEIHVRFTKTTSSHKWALTPDGRQIEEIFDGRKIRFFCNGKRIKKNPFKKFGLT